MSQSTKPMDNLIRSLEERAKELNCLYKTEEFLSNQSLSIEETLKGIVDAIPPGWQYPEFTYGRITLNDTVVTTDEFKETNWRLASEILVQEIKEGCIEVFYSEEMPEADEGPFLKEERKLINTLAERIGHNILHTRLKSVFNEWQDKKDTLLHTPKPEWIVVLDMLKKTDHNLFSIISRKMLNTLFCTGIEESKELFIKLGTDPELEDSAQTEVNRPSQKKVLESSYNLGEEIFSLASKFFSEEELLKMIQKWMHEEKSHYLVKALANLNTPLTEIADAIRRYHHINPETEEESSPISKGIRVSLIRRFLTDQLQFIDIAKNFCELNDFYYLLQNMIFPSESHGKLGGKSAGLFLARKIIEKCSCRDENLVDVKTPKTWYITSDGLLNFLYYNNLEDISEQKYKNIDDVRNEYPHIIQAFKNSSFPAEIANGLSRALDNFGDSPIIVRSSSLLEDRMGSAFAGKYKSLFLANQGTKQEKLDALMDAISEVYASTFGPDPIGYRLERGLLDFNEEMGIMIQEVVGKKVGDYFFPAIAGVAFSNNEFRWSSRISRDDGLIRMVPGLGTRAVDRIGDDYPILIAPGKPELRVNLSYEDIIKFSPKNIDVINLKSNTFETIQIENLVDKVGNQYPMLNDVFSIREEGHLRTPIGLGIDTAKHDIIATFENLIRNTKYINQLDRILKELSNRLFLPVDIEFACDGENLYLLQCRPQSSASDNVSALIPRDISKDKIVFTANKYISNGKVPDITYIVYVDPDKYSQHENLEDLKNIGKTVGLLNKALPKKTFILMGPGRWGSRDDIRLGVKVSYSDINNSAVLIEIAKQKGKYVPDLSFGTHFFQDLVEASIRYLPLYPDDNSVIFNNEFFENAENTLDRFIPDSEKIADTIKVINVRETTGGMVLRLLMNADEDEAMAILTESQVKPIYKTQTEEANKDMALNEPLHWRIRMAESISEKLDYEHYNVKALYLFGTVNNETAGPNSDIDLLFVLSDKADKEEQLKLWLDGWNQCLRQINYNKSGYDIEEILDIHLIRESELAENHYFREIVHSDNAARRLTRNSHT